MTNFMTPTMTIMMAMIAAVQLEGNRTIRLFIFYFSVNFVFIFLSPA